MCQKNRVSTDVSKDIGVLMSTHIGATSLAFSHHLFLHYDLSLLLRKALVLRRRADQALHLAKTRSRRPK